MADHWQILRTVEGSATVYCAGARNWSEAAEVVRSVDPGCAVLVVADATGVSVGEVDIFAEAVAGLGCFVVACWGPNCEWVHDLIDWSVVLKEIAMDPPPTDTLQTTWHDHESLAATVEFLAHYLRFSSEAESRCELRIVNVGSFASIAVIREAVAAIEAW